MKIKHLIFSLFIHHILLAPSAITYLENREWGGRFGDKLIMYIKAKWISLTHNIPLFYKGFIYSDQLKMHELETHWHPSYIRQYRQKTLLNNPKTVIQSLSFHHQNLYIMHPFFALTDWPDLLHGYNLFEGYTTTDFTEIPAIWHNSVLRDELRKTIAPRTHLSLIAPPTDRITVAVHIRQGGGGDFPLLSKQTYDSTDAMHKNIVKHHPRELYADCKWPLKFPPTQFYIDQIKELSNIYNDQPMYVHIFTDDRNPAEQTATIKKEVNKANISYGYREKGNSPQANILEDFFSMLNFDCLVRSGSYYSQVAHLIGHFKIVLYPKSHVWHEDCMVIDKVGKEINEKLLQ